MNWVYIARKGKEVLTQVTHFFGITPIVCVPQTSVPVWLICSRFHLCGAITIHHQTSQMPDDNQCDLRDTSKPKILICSWWKTGACRVSFENNQRKGHQFVFKFKVGSCFFFMMVRIVRSNLFIYLGFWAGKGNNVTLPHLFWLSFVNVLSNRKNTTIVIYVNGCQSAARQDNHPPSSSLHHSSSCYWTQGPTQQ